MFSQIGIPGLLMLLIVCLLAFGSKNLPKVGRSIGESLREFKTGMNEDVSSSENSSDTVNESRHDK